jgi:hypothetical protein
MDAVAGAAAGYARGGFLVIVDCVIGPWLLPAFQQTGCPLHYIILRVDPVLAVARCQRRGGDTLTDPGSITDLNNQFRQLGAFERYAMDVDDLFPEAAVAAIEEAVASGGFRLSVSKP